jgi:alkanesulfonate monooxygenase SsuD/methylene tetrahydromethanopterin reductase-like flavin-dependent oxidoreductase (luciferase family)
MDIGRKPGPRGSANTGRTAPIPCNAASAPRHPMARAARRLSQRNKNVRFGICYNVDYHRQVHGSPADYYEQMLSQCVLLEDLGYDSAWFSEHHSGPYSFGNPALMIASAAHRTKRLKLGTGVSLLPLHHPVALSEEYAMLDQLSAGRLEYGIGRGYLLHEYPWLNVDLAESNARYRESVDFIRKAWSTEGPMSFKGEFYAVDGYTPFPGVVQKPHPPIYASAVSPESFVYAGQNNLDVGISIFSSDPTTLPGSVATYEKALAENGFDRAAREVMGITQMYCARDEQEALSEGRTYAENYFKFFSRILAEGSGGQSPVADRMSKVDALELNAANMTLFGSPASLVDKIARMRDELHLDYLQLEVAQGGCSPDKVVSVLRLFGEQVIPHFK